MLGCFRATALKFLVRKSGAYSGPIFGATLLQYYRAVHKSGPPGGPLLRTAFRPILFFLAQAGAVWHWWNFAVSRVPAGKRVLRLNLDETSVCLFPGTAKGTIMVKKRRLDAGPEVAQRMQKAHRRTCLTHVGIICDHPGLQPLLPQVIIGNESTFLLRDWEELLHGTPPNVFLARQKSAWNSASMCVRVIELLAAALRPHLQEFQAILLLDACRLHIHQDVLRACVSAGIWPVVVPARTTWLLQPCDSHAFQKYKMYLKAAYHRKRATTAAGVLDVSAFLEVLYDTIKCTLRGRRWASAFDEDGFGNDQSGLSSFVKRQLALEQPPAVTRTPPSADELSLCFPKRAAVRSDIALQPLRQLALPRPMAKGRPLFGRRSGVRAIGAAASSSSGNAAIAIAPPTAPAQAQGS